MRSRTSCRSSRGLRRGVVAAAALISLGLTAASAQAKERYVTPAGSGTDCTQSKPCSIVTGVNQALGGDRVHVAGGTYPPVSVPLTTLSGVAVVGEGEERPRITFAPLGQLYTVGTVSGLDLTRESGVGVMLIVGPGGSASRMKVEAPPGILPVEAKGLIRDSFVRSAAGGVPAVQVSGGGGQLRNVTAVAEGADSAGVAVYSSGFMPCTPGEATLRNVIARGAFDLVASGAFSCGASIDVGHSNFRAGAVQLGTGGTLIDAGGNQTDAEPLLAGDGFRQLAGSPTIDAGVATPENGTLDIDGEPRPMGNAPDIGADEFPTVADTTAPVGSALRLTPRRFRPARRRKASISAPGARKRKRAPRTSRVGYSLSEEATVRFTVKRKLRGRRRGKRCVTGKAARRLKGKRCRKLVAVRGSFSHPGTAGANGFRFNGILGGRPIRPGAYRLIGVPTDPAGNVGREFGAPFRIARG